ncbi:hypothetical protein KAH37_04295, partial [bacterium]|nr:hypothetical protein [bacterium]
MKLKLTIFTTLLALSFLLQGETPSVETVPSENTVQKEEMSTEPLSPKAAVKKPLKYFEFSGYFGFNFRLSHNMILDGNNPYLSSTALKDVIEDDTTGDKSLDPKTGEKLLTWATLKLFLHPVINVGELMQIHTTFSVFGNLIMGGSSTLAPSMENGVIPSSQLSANPAILFEGLWGSFETPVGVLSVGRMPFDWGLGILHSSKNRYTNTVVGEYYDRIQFAVPIAGFTITPAFDFASVSMKAPYRDYFIDASNQDNGYQVNLIFSKIEADKQLFKQKLMREEFVYEVGALATFAWKKKGAAEWDQ